MAPMKGSNNKAKLDGKIAVITGSAKFLKLDLIISILENLSYEKVPTLVSAKRRPWT